MYSDRTEFYKDGVLLETLGQVGKWDYPFYPWLNSHTGTSYVKLDVLRVKSDPSLIPEPATMLLLVGGGLFGLLARKRRLS